MSILDQIISGIHKTKYQYVIQHVVDDVKVVVLISHGDYCNMRNDIRTYLYDYGDAVTKREIRVHGSLVLTTPDLEEGDIRFLVELPQ